MHENNFTLCYQEQHPREFVRDAAALSCSGKYNAGGVPNPVTGRLNYTMSSMCMGCPYRKYEAPITRSQ